MKNRLSPSVHSFCKYPGAMAIWSLDVETVASKSIQSASFEMYVFHKAVESEG